MLINFVNFSERSLPFKTFYFLFYCKQTLKGSIKTKNEKKEKTMNAKYLGFVISVKAIIHFLL